MCVPFLSEDNSKFPFDVSTRNILFHVKMQHIYKDFKFQNNIDFIYTHMHPLLYVSLHCTSYKLYFGEKYIYEMLMVKQIMSIKKQL